MPDAGPSAQDAVIELAGDLIRIDSSNYGDGSGPGEREAAEYRDMSNTATAGSEFAPPLFLSDLYASPSRTRHSCSTSSTPRNST